MTNGNFAGSLNAPDGSILNIDIGGDLTGWLDASAGGIGDIDVGGVVDVVRVGTSGIRSMNGLNSLQCDSVSANTQFGLVAGNGPGVVGLLKTRSGDFAGILNCKSLSSSGLGEDGIRIAGDMTGTLRVQDGGTLAKPIVITSALSGLLRFDDDLPAFTGVTTVTITENAGLTGQIVFNTDDGSGTWDGTVVVGNGGSAITLSPSQSQPYHAPNYQVSAEDLGGGAVGGIRYTLHDYDCYPINGQGNLTLEPTTTVLLSHYGPIYWAPSSAPFLIDWAEAGTEEWEALPTSDFSYTLDPDNHKDVYITALTDFDFKAGWDYRIRPNPGVLKCEFGDNTINVDDYEYLIHGN